MALSHLTDGVVTGSSANITVTTASVTIPVGQVAIFSVAAARNTGTLTDAQFGTPTSSGVTWVPITSAEWGSRRGSKCWFARNDGGSSAVGAITLLISTGATAQEAMWSVDLESEPAAGTTLGALFGTPATNGGNASSGSVTVPGTPAAGDKVFAFFAHEDASDTITLGSELDTTLVQRGSGANVRRILSAYDLAPDGTPVANASWSSSHNWGAIAVILKAGPAADVTDPVLTGSITEVSKTDTTIEVSCPTASDNTGVTGYDWSDDDGATWSAPGTTTHTFTGLTPSTAYDIQVRARDAAGNTSTPPLSITITTNAPTPDTTDPTLTGPLTVTAKTSTGYTLGGWTADDNVAVADIEVSLDNQSSWTSIGLVSSYDVTGRTNGATDLVAVRAKDTATTPNYSTPLTASVLVEAPATEDVSITALLFPGKYSDDANARMKLTGADMPSRFAMTATAQVYFNQHSSYYGFFTVQDDLGVETWSGGHYEYIACPYATTSGAVDANGLFTSTDGGAVHHFEIGGHTPLGSSTSEDRGAAAGDTAILVRKGVWLQMIMKTEVVNISGTDYEKHSLWPDIELYPNKAIVGYKALADFPTPTNPALMIGSFKWAPQNATYNDEPMDGRVRALRIIKGVLPLDKAKLELAAAVRGTGAWATTEASAFGGTILDNPTLANISSTPWTWDNADRPTDYSGTMTVPALDPVGVGGLGIQEAGSDTAVIAGVARSIGAVSIQEIGSETSTLAGSSRSVASLSAQESGSDQTTIGAAHRASGSFATQEASNDLAVISGASKSISSIAVQEAAQDVTAIAANTTAIAAVSAVESGSDVATIGGQVQWPGVLGSTITLTTGTGTDGAGILYNDMRSGDDAKRYTFTITRAPTNGTLSLDPDGTGTYDGTSDSFDYELFEDGVSVGTTTVSLGFVGDSAGGIAATQESGSDTATMTGKARARASLAVQDTGEVVAIAGSAKTIGLISVQESEAESVSASGATKTYGALSTQEAVPDSVAFTSGDQPVTPAVGFVATVEPGSDAVTVLAGTKSSGQVQASELQRDIPSVQATVAALIAFAIQEASTDSTHILGAALTGGNMAIVEAESDTVLLTTAVTEIREIPPSGYLSVVPFDTYISIVP